MFIEPDDPTVEGSMGALKLLANHATAPLRDLELYRIMLDRNTPSEMVIMWGELALYSLIGLVEVYVVGIPSLPNYTYAMGGRQSILTPSLDVLRVTSPRENHVAMHITLKADSADLLLARSKVQINLDPQLTVQGPHAAYIHDVGTGAHRREVRELPVPKGFSIHVGETYAPAGAWSSWPSHCAPGEEDRYAEHEEVMHYIVQDYAIMKRQGTYCTGVDVDDIIKIANNTTIVAPWGNHEIVSSPAGWTLYQWSYLNSWVKKTYNRWAHEGVRTYVK